MKKISSLFVALLLCGAAFAEQTLLLDSIITASDAGVNRQKEVYTYSTSALPTGLQVFNWANNAWAPTYQYQLSYQTNAEGLPTVQNWQISTASGLTLITRVKYEYTDGKLTSEIKESLSAVGNTWSPLSRRTYVYDAAGKVEKIVEEMASSGSWDDWYTYIVDAEASTAQKMVTKVYWTGYEEDGVVEIVSFYYSEHAVTALSNTTASPRSTKIVRDGQVLILRDGRTYNILGAEVK